jgi:hypothetical protein
MQSENTNELAAALAKAQGQMEPAILNKTVTINPTRTYKYADLAAVIDALRKPLSSNGLSYTQAMEIRDGGLALVTTLRHTSGQWVASEHPLPAGSRPQDFGSALTYAKRYSLSSLCGVSADGDLDDDGQLAEKNGQTNSAPVAKSPIKPQPVAAPVSAETGEVSPHKLTQPEGTPKWGGAFVAAVNTARDDAEIEAWIADNAEGLDALKGASEKAYNHVMAAVKSKRASFKEAA